MLLQALNLHKQYDDLPVLRGVNVDIHEGEFVAIIGQSGSGKTTLLHSLSGLTPIDRGDIFIGEHRITSKDAFSRRKRRRDARRVAIAKLRRDHIGFIFQDLNLIESLNVEDNLRLPAKLARVSVPDQEINDALDYVGLTGKAHAYPRPALRWATAARGYCACAGAQTPVAIRGRAHRVARCAH